MTNVSVVFIITRYYIMDKGEQSTLNVLNNITYTQKNINLTFNIKNIKSVQNLGSFYTLKIHGWWDLSTNKFPSGVILQSLGTFLFQSSTTYSNNLAFSNHLTNTLQTKLHMCMLALVLVRSGQPNFSLQDNRSIQEPNDVHSWNGSKHISLPSDTA